LPPGSWPRRWARARHRLQPQPEAQRAGDSLGAVDEVVTPGSSPDEVVEQVMELTKGAGRRGGGRLLGYRPAPWCGLRSTRAGGRLVLVGEGGELNSMSAKGSSTRSGASSAHGSPRCRAWRTSGAPGAVEPPP
jgi:hypothetical protein